MDEYKLTAEQALEITCSSENGLTSEIACERLKKNGANELAQGKKTPLIIRFLKQLADPMILILLVAAVVSLVLTIINNSNPDNEKESFADVIIISAVVLLNATLSVIQEGRAEKSLAALQNMTKAHAKVLRDGVQTTVDSSDLVVGDVVVLEAGDGVPADCRILFAASLKAEESALTGESVPVDKNALPIASETTLAERKNMLYMGSTIAYGRATAVVVATGMSTEMGKIAHVIANAREEKTPLQIKMAQLSRILTYVVVGISLFIFGFNLIVKGFAVDSVMNSLFTAIGLAVAAIPEGLATVVTIVLSIGVTNMSKKNAIIRKLTAVETLGCAEIICSDKTGTLTQNVMTVVETYTENEQALIYAMSLCNDCVVKDGQAQGEPTEKALVNYGLKLNYNKSELELDLPRVAEVPFDSERKMMSTLHKWEQKVIQFTKGAPDEIISRCNKILIDGEAQLLTDDKKQEILERNKQMADKALRVLACSYVTYDALPEDVAPDKIERNMVFVGLCGMIDPVRDEVYDAVERCKSAGIRPIMITGDHIDTAVAIAMQLKIIDDPSQALLGAALDKMTDEQFEQVIGNYSVYARVQPEHKVRIVNTWKKLGKVCAMTGDGVNDAPAIKSADIGVGMGITGTDVTKAAADMTLTDDNFATIVTAVAEGRRIYDNIRKAIQFLLSSNLAEVIAVFVATLCGFTLLKPAHLLWINLITDTLPAVALGMEPAEADVMSRPPRNKKSGIFADGLGVNVLVHGVFVAAITLSAYFVGCHLQGTGLDSEQGMTMAFLTMSTAELFHSFNARSMDKSLFKTKGHNKLLWVGLLGALALSTAVIFIPGLNTAFGFADGNGTAYINFYEYLISIALSFAIVPLVELQKVIINAVKCGKRKHN